MKRTWPGEKIQWTKKQTDKLTEYYTGCGETYYYEIHPSTALGWKLYYRMHENNPLQLIGTADNMMPLRQMAEGKDGSL